MNATTNQTEAAPSPTRHTVLLQALAELGHYAMLEQLTSADQARELEEEYSKLEEQLEQQRSVTVKANIEIFRLQAQITELEKDKANMKVAAGESERQYMASLRDEQAALEIIRDAHSKLADVRKNIVEENQLAPAGKGPALEHVDAAIEGMDEVLKKLGEAA